LIGSLLSKFLGYVLLPTLVSHPLVRCLYTVAISHSIFYFLLWKFFIGSLLSKFLCYVLLLTLVSHPWFSSFLNQCFQFFPRFCPNKF
jgi:hypothetical protein